MNIAEFTNKIKIGDAYKLGSGLNEVFGRIVGFDETSACYNGEYAIVRFATPGGTVLKTGRVYLNKIVTEEDFAELERYEKLARERGALLYDGLIEI